MGKDVLRVVESAYDVDRPSGDWLKSVAAEAYAHLGAGMGILAFDYTVTPDFRMTVGDTVQIEAPRPLAEARCAQIAKLPPEHVKRSYTRCECTSLSEVLRRDPMLAANNQGMTQRLAHEFGVRDIVMVGGMDPDGNGVYLGAWWPTARRLPPAFKARWCRVATHLVAARRIRKRLHQRADALLTPAGKVAHANGEAADPDSREALRAAVKEIERARSAAGRREPDVAIERWKALVDCRWSLIDHFESDGKRYVVARRNDVAVKGYSELSDREHQVLAYAALGHTNKLIAYEMGIAYSTVRVLLYRAASKLGVRRREDLVARFLEGRRAAGG